MPEIQYIKNVTASNHFEGSAGQFSKSLTSIPVLNPDEVITRAINFNGEANDNMLYLVWCNLTNDFIASFCGGNIAPHAPGTTIWLNAPVPNALEFKLYAFPSIANTDPQFVTVMKGDLALHLDFIKYKRTPIHAKLNIDYLD